MAITAGSTLAPESMAASTSWRCSIWATRASVAAARRAMSPEMEVVGGAMGAGARTRRAVAKTDQARRSSVSASIPIWTGAESRNRRRWLPSWKNRSRSRKSFAVAYVAWVMVRKCSLTHQHRTHRVRRKSSKSWSSPAPAKPTNDCPPSSARLKLTRTG